MNRPEQEMRELLFIRSQHQEAIRKIDSRIKNLSAKHELIVSQLGEMKE